MESGNLGSKSQLSHRLTERLRSLRNSVGLSLPPCKWAYCCLLPKVSAKMK